MASSNYGYSNLTKGVTDGHETSIGALETDMTAEKAKIVTLQSDMVDEKAKIVTLQGEVSALETSINTSDNNDDKVKAAIAAVLSYLNDFSETYVVMDSEDNVIDPPDWAALTTSINSLEDHEI